MKKNSIVKLSALMLLSNSAFSAIVVDLSQGKEIVMNAFVMPGVTEEIQIKKMTPKAAAFCSIETVGIPLVFSKAPAKAFPADGTTNVTVNKHNDSIHVINITTNHSPLAMASSQGVYNVQAIKATLAQNTTGKPIEVKIVCKHLSIDATAPEAMKPKADKVDLTIKEDPNKAVAEGFIKTAQDTLKLAVDTKSTPENFVATGTDKLGKLQDKITEGRDIHSKLIDQVLKAQVQTSIQALEDDFKDLGNAIERAKQEIERVAQAKKEQEARDKFIQDKIVPAQAEIKRLHDAANAIDIWDAGTSSISVAFTDALNALIQYRDQVVALDGDAKAVKVTLDALIEEHKDAVKSIQKKLIAKAKEASDQSFAAAKGIWDAHGGDKASVGDVKKTYAKKDVANDEIFNKVVNHYMALNNIEGGVATWSVAVPNLDAHKKAIEDYMGHWNTTILPGLDD